MHHQTEIELNTREGQALRERIKATAKAKGLDTLQGSRAARLRAHRRRLAVMLDGSVLAAGQGRPAVAAGSP